MAGQLWSTNSLGGFMYSDELSDVLRTALQPACKFRQFCDAKDATAEGYGKELHAGTSFHWNVYNDVATQGTTLAEGTAMPETNFTISQGTLTITEYGNSVPYTGFLDDNSRQPVMEIVKRALKNDAKKALDVAAHAQFNATPLVVQPTGGTSTSAVTIYTNGTATQTINATATLSNEHVKSISDAMKERNIGPFMGDDYFALSHPTSYRGFKNDLEAINQYTDAGFQRIVYGETGRYESVRFVEQNNISKLSGVSGAGGWVFFFGEDTVAEAMTIPEEIRGKIPADYGRSKGVAWYYLGGFGLVHTVAAQARVLKWTTL